jgi:hypothetical protein
MTDLFAEVTQPQIDPNKNYLQELVGEDKKFKTPEDLAKGKYLADEYINTLNRRDDQLRADYLRVMEENKARASLDERINQLLELQKTTSSENTQAKEVETKPVIDTQKIEDLVSKSIQQHEAVKTETQNFNFVMNKLKEKYGANYQTTLNQQIDDLGLSKDMVNEFAKKSPKALLKTLGLDEQVVPDLFQTPPRSNSGTFAPTGAKRKTWSYYQELKKTNPKLYYDPKIAVEMHNQHSALGKEFEDGDFRIYGDGS